MFRSEDRKGSPQAAAGSDQVWTLYPRQFAILVAPADVVVHSLSATFMPLRDSLVPMTATMAVCKLTHDFGRTYPFLFALKYPLLFSGAGVRGFCGMSVAVEQLNVTEDV